MNVLSCIGKTPVVRLARVAPDVVVYAKGEHLNPGGSIKDRIALVIIDAAEREGELETGRDAG